MGALVHLGSGMDQRARAHSCRPAGDAYEDGSSQAQLAAEPRAVAEARVGAVDGGQRRRHKHGQLHHEQLARELGGGVVAADLVPAGLVVKGLQECGSCFFSSNLAHAAVSEDTTTMRPGEGEGEGEGGLTVVCASLKTCSSRSTRRAVER